MARIYSTLVAALMLTTATASADNTERTFSYPESTAGLQYFGNSKAETHDIAVRLSGPAFTGRKVSAVKVALCPDATTLSNPKGWMSTQLLVDNKKHNAPDIVTVDATLSDDNVLTATFAEPYTITDGGVYVGYSITVGKAATFGDKNPNPVAPCSHPDGAYIHSTRTDLRWSDLADYGVASCLEVTLTGDFADNAAGVVSVADVRTDGQSNSVTVPVTIINTGSVEVNSIGYTWTFGGTEPVAATHTLDTPLSAKYASQQTVDLSIPTCFETTDLTIAVTEVNGVPNGQPGASATGRYTYMTFVPVTRPLMEEYTGLWCGYCTRGFVAMEMLSELYPDDFVCVSYHSNGSSAPGGEALQYLEVFPNEPDGYPCAFMNRSLNVDPYYGTSNSTPFNIKDDWLKLRTLESPADIDVELEWADDNETRLRCRTTTRFIDDCDGEDYRINYILVGDGFRTTIVLDDKGEIDKNASVILQQANNYAGKAPLDDSPLWDQVVNGGSTCTSLVFNDIAMANDNIDGVEAFPAAIKANERYTHEYYYDYADLLTYEYEYDEAVGDYVRRNVIPDRGKIRCVAVLLTADGRVVNCNKSKHVGSAGIADITLGGNQDIISTEWYDMQGRRVLNPGDGIFIKVDRLGDGTVRRTKSINR